MYPAASTRLVPCGAGGAPRVPVEPRGLPLVAEVPLDAHDFEQNLLLLLLAGVVKNGFWQNSHAFSTESPVLRPACEQSAEQYFLGIDGIHRTGFPHVAHGR